MSLKSMTYDYCNGIFLQRMAIVIILRCTPALVILETYYVHLKLNFYLGPASNWWDLLSFVFPVYALKKSYQSTCNFGYVNLCQFSSPWEFCAFMYDNRSTEIVTVLPHSWVYYIRWSVYKAALSHKRYLGKDWIKCVQVFSISLYYIGKFKRLSVRCTVLLAAN